MVKNILSVVGNTIVYVFIVIMSIVNGMFLAFILNIKNVNLAQELYIITSNYYIIVATAVTAILCYKKSLKKYVLQVTSFIVYKVIKKLPNSSLHP